MFDSKSTVVLQRGKVTKMVWTLSHFLQYVGYVPLSVTTLKQNVKEVPPCAAKNSSDQSGPGCRASVGQDRINIWGEDLKCSSMILLSISVLTGEAAAFGECCCHAELCSASNTYINPMAPGFPAEHCNE